MPDGNKMSYVLKQTCSFLLEVCLNGLFLPPDVSSLSFHMMRKLSQMVKIVCTTQKLTLGFFYLCEQSHSPANNYLFKVNNKKTRKSCEICSKLTTETRSLWGKIRGKEKNCRIGSHLLHKSLMQSFIFFALKTLP